MPCTPGTESPWLWFPGLVHPVPQTKSTARCAPPGLVPGHMKGDTLHLSLLITQGSWGAREFRTPRLHPQPAPTRTHAHLCEEPLPAPHPPLSSPGLGGALSSPSQGAPCVPATVSVLPSFHSFSPLFSIFPPTPTPLRVWTLIVLSFSSPPRRPLCVPSAPLVFPARTF